MRQYQKRVGLRYGMSPGEAQARGLGAASHGRSTASPDRGGGGGNPNQDRANEEARARAAAEASAKAQRDMQAKIAEAERSEANRIAEASAKAQRDMQAKIVEAERAQAIKEKMQRATRGYMKPVLLPTKRKPTVYETSGTGPFERDGRDYQDKIRQEKTKIEFDPNLSREEKADRNKILDDFEYKGTFVSEPKRYGIKNLMMDALLFGSGVGALGSKAKAISGLYSGAKKGQQLAELVKPGITEDLLGKIKLSGNENVNRLNVRDTRDRDTRDGQRVSTGTDAVTRSIKKYTGEKETQQTDSKRSQLLLLLKKLQQYDSQNRLNDRGKQYLSQLVSFINQPLPGRNRDI